jgi:hypothetical protein
MIINFTKNGTSKDTIKAMFEAVKLGVSNPKNIKLAETLPADEKVIFDYVFRHIYYVPDKEGEQTVRTLNRSLRETVGNCVDYSVALATLLELKKIKWAFKKISETGRGYNHVYLITENNILDCVQGQDQTGMEYFKLDHQRKPQFNKEVKYKKSKIFSWY